MGSVLEKSKVLFALLGCVLGWLMGEPDSLIYSLIVLVVLDYVTGVLLAVRNKKVSSEIGFRGICKKITIFILVAVGNVIDKYIIGTGHSLRTMIIAFYLSNEGISIMENAGRMGLPIPKILKESLLKLHNNPSDNPKI